MRKKKSLFFLIKAIKPEGFERKKNGEITWIPMQHRSYVREKSVPVLHKKWTRVHLHTHERKEEEETLLYFPSPLTFPQVQGVIREGLCIW